jgi:hypothetical protein
VQSLSTWRNAVAAAAAAFGVTHVAALRGGALVDHGIPDLPHWRLAPAKGGGLLKTMIRTRIAGDREAGRTISAADLMTAAQTAPIELAGNWLGTEMVTQLDEAEAVIAWCEPSGRILAAHRYGCAPNRRMMGRCQLQ